MIKLFISPPPPALCQTHPTQSDDISTPVQLCINIHRRIKCTLSLSVSLSLSFLSPSPPIPIHSVLSLSPLELTLLSANFIEVMTQSWPFSLCSLSRRWQNSLQCSTFTVDTTTDSCGDASGSGGHSPELE